MQIIQVNECPHDMRKCSNSSSQQRKLNSMLATICRSSKGLKGDPYCKSLCELIQLSLSTLYNSKHPQVQYRAWWAYVYLTDRSWPCSMIAAWHLYYCVGKGQHNGASPLHLLPWIARKCNNVTSKRRLGQWLGVITTINAMHATHHNPIAAMAALPPSACPPICNVLCHLALYMQYANIADMDRV